MATTVASDTTSSFRFVYRTPLGHLVRTSPAEGGASLASFVDGTPGTTRRDGASCTGQALAGEEQTGPQVRDDALADAPEEHGTALTGT